MTPRERAEALLAEGVPMGRIGMVAFRGRIEAAIRSAEAEAYERAAKVADGYRWPDGDGWTSGEAACCAVSNVADLIRALASKEQR